ncbi:MAG TPA: type II and III secretion system protein family protein [Pyrinomonadaceae bacterium]|nr:type II and III secretion system protein family protein [Pyrinomonadaceae bacterium]
MHTDSTIARPLTLLSATVITLLVLVSLAHAQEATYDASFSHNKDNIAVNVLVGQSKVINFDRPIGRFSISNPDIAEAVLVAPDQVIVNGKAFGQINFIAWEQGGEKRFIVFDVYVRANLSLIDSQIRALFPKEDIRLSQANGSVVISGNAADGIVTQVDAIVQAAGFKTVNLLQSPVKSATQVQLQIRVAEVSRNRLKDVGISTLYQASPGVGGFISGGGPGNLSSATGGILSGTFGSALNVFVMGGNTANMIRAMQTNGTLRALAEPNMVAMDGQTASFLAGGEFPVPVVQGSGGGAGSNAVTIEFKQYGVRLNFKPTVIDEDHIRLELEPEVSTIDFANGVRFNGFVIPALRTRRAKTAVELRDGQSFALAGLLDNNETRSLSKIPVLGDIPILGNLFKSTSFQKNETELMFIVTAQLVKPVEPDDLPKLRGIDGLKKGSPLGVEPKGSGVQGASGFSTEKSGIAPTQPAAPAIAPATTPATPVTPVKTGESKTGGQ